MSYPTIKYHTTLIHYKLMIIGVFTVCLCLGLLNSPSGLNLKILRWFFFKFGFVCVFFFLNVKVLN